MPHTKAKAFTLAELLIALAILGVIATFTIPKILSAQGDSQKNAIAKEIIATVSNAHYLAKTNGELSTTSTVDSLTPYMNYVAVDTTSSIDGLPNGAASHSCVAPYRCLRFHNGAVLLYNTTLPVNIPATSIALFIDPDGQMTSKKDTLGIVLYSNSKITDFSDWAGPNSNPAWFSW